jgi:hypothetical protein
LPQPIEPLNSCNNQAYFKSYFAPLFEPITLLDTDQNGPYEVRLSEGALTKSYPGLEVIGNDIPGQDIPFPIPVGRVQVNVTNTNGTLADTIKFLIGEKDTYTGDDVVTRGASVYDKSPNRILMEEYIWPNGGSRNGDTNFAARLARMIFSSLF